MQFLADVWAYTWAVVFHWANALGVVLGIVVYAWEKTTESKFPARKSLMILSGCFLIACFFAWREQSQEVRRIKEKEFAPRLAIVEADIRQKMNLDTGKPECDVAYFRAENTQEHPAADVRFQFIAVRTDFQGEPLGNSMVERTNEVGKNAKFSFETECFKRELLQPAMIYIGFSYRDGYANDEVRYAQPWYFKYSGPDNKGGFDTALVDLSRTEKEQFNTYLKAHQLLR